MLSHLGTILSTVLLVGVLGLASATDPDPDCEPPTSSGFWDALGVEPLPFDCPPDEGPATPAPVEPGATFEDYNSPPELSATPSYHTLLARPTSGELTTLLIDVASDTAVAVVRESGTTNIAGSVYLGPDRNPFVVILGDQGLPRYATYQELLYVYGNYSDSTVDVAVLRNNQVLFVQQAGVDPAIMQLLRSGAVAAIPTQAPPADGGADEYHASTNDITDFDLDVIGLQLASGALTVAACYVGGPLALAACGELALLALGGYADLAAEIGLIEELPPGERYTLFGWLPSAVGAVGGAVQAESIVGGFPSLVSGFLSASADRIQQTRIRNQTFDLVLRSTEEALSYSRGQLAFILARDRSNTLDMIVQDPDNNAISILRPATARGSDAEIIITPDFTKTLLWRDGLVKAGSYHLFVENRGNQVREVVVTQRLGGQGFVFAEEVAPGERILLRSFDLIP